MTFRPCALSAKLIARPLKTRETLAVKTKKTKCTLKDYGDAYRCLLAVLVLVSSRRAQ